MDSAEPDVDLLRRIALALEPLQRSPPEPVILSLAALSVEFSCSPRRAADALERLAELSLIEGPGRFLDAWLFRRITLKGQVFLDEVRSDAHWDRIKNAYERPED